MTLGESGQRVSLFARRKKGTEAAVVAASAAAMLRCKEVYVLSECSAPSRHVWPNGFRALKYVLLLWTRVRSLVVEREFLNFGCLQRSRILEQVILFKTI